MHKGIAYSQVLPDTSDVRNLQNAGITLVRLEAGPDWGAGPVAYLDRFGIATVLLVGSALIPSVPQEVWNADAGSLYFKAAQNTWQQAIRKVFATKPYPAYVEIWNEGNCWTDPPLLRGDAPTGRTYFRPENYVLFLSDAAQIIREVSPDTKIVSTGLFGHEVSGVEYLKIVRQWMSAQSDFPVDFIGYHPYYDIAGGLQTNKLLTALQELHAVGGKPILITEAGWSTKLCTLERQASNVAALLSTCKASGIVEGCCVFSYQDSPGAVPPVFYGTYGKPAWQAIKSA